MLQKAEQTLRDASNDLEAEHFETAQELAGKAIELFRLLHDKAIDNQKRVEERNVITRAIVNTLRQLSYDEPAVRYVMKEGEASEKNPRLGNLTIKANTASGIGNMKLQIHLDGKIDLDVDSIPEGKEQECHDRIIQLQKNIETVVDLQITDWGRARDVVPELPGSVPTGDRMKVRQVEKIKERQGGSG